MEEIDLADTDFCIVEYFDDETSKLFEVEKKVIKHGTCEYCNKQQYLRYPCICREVMKFLKKNSKIINQSFIIPIDILLQNIFNYFLIKKNLFKQS